MPQLFKEDEVARNTKYWSAKKTRPAMIGVVAKTAVHPSRAATLGLTLRPEFLELPAIRALFAEIMLAKFRANTATLAALLDTGNVLLVECGRLAGSLTAKGAPPRWTGLVKDGELMGQNLMGPLSLTAAGSAPAASSMVTMASALASFSATGSPSTFCAARISAVLCKSLSRACTLAPALISAAHSVG